MRIKQMLVLGIGALGLIWVGWATLYKPILVLNATPFPLEYVVAADAGNLGPFRALRPVVSEAGDDPLSAVGMLLGGSTDAAVLPVAVLLDSRASGQELMAVALLVRPEVVEDMDDGIALVVSYSLIERDPERVAAVTRAVVSRLNAALDDVQNRTRRLPDGAEGDWLRRHAAAMRSDTYRVGDASPRLWNHLSNRLRAKGIISRPVHPQSVYTDRFLPYPPPIRR